MTIREVNENTIACDWFDKQGRLQKAEFFTEQLKEDRDQTAEDIAAVLVKRSRGDS